jgi:tRNA-dihydrouridine synthase B
MNINIQSEFNIGTLRLPHRLIQGPLAGYSCAAMREQFSKFHRPAYSVTEMISAKDILHKHQSSGRYLYKSPDEGLLAYQIAGNHPEELMLAAKKCEAYGADLIDLNCGCPKPKMRKKGYGSALLSNPKLLQEIISKIKENISIPLTVKIRIQSPEQDLEVVQKITEAGADAIVVHGRTIEQDYDIPCHYQTIQKFKNYTHLPVIANGDISDINSLNLAIQHSQVDAYMISRAGCGQPWLYQMLLNPKEFKSVSINTRIDLFISHLNNLKTLESEHQALLQARSLIKYYFRPYRNSIHHSIISDTNSITNLAENLIHSFSNYDMD